MTAGCRSRRAGLPGSGAYVKELLPPLPKMALADGAAGNFRADLLNGFIAIRVQTRGSGLRLNIAVDASMSKENFRRVKKRGALPRPRRMAGAPRSFGRLTIGSATERGTSKVEELQSCRVAELQSCRVWVTGRTEGTLRPEAGEGVARGRRSAPSHWLTKPLLIRGPDLTCAARRQSSRRLNSGAMPGGLTLTAQFRNL
jgi:hypothetical protein